MKKGKEAIRGHLEPSVEMSGPKVAEAASTCETNEWTAVIEGEKKERTLMGLSHSSLRGKGNKRLLVVSSERPLAVWMERLNRQPSLSLPGVALAWKVASYFSLDSAISEIDHFEVG